MPGKSLDIVCAACDNREVPRTARNEDDDMTTTTTTYAAPSLVPPTARAMTTEQRIAHALDVADEAFWAAVAHAFPEAKYGDLPPDAVDAFQRAALAAATAWVASNVEALTGDEGGAR